MNRHLFSEANIFRYVNSNNFGHHRTLEALYQNILTFPSYSHRELSLIYLTEYDIFLYLLKSLYSCSTCLVHVYHLSPCGCRIQTDAKPVSTDILVRSDGTVKHAIQLYTTVVCAMNLFTYPFVTDACPVALNGWRENSRFKCNLFNLRCEV